MNNSSSFLMQPDKVLNLSNTILINIIFAICNHVFNMCKDNYNHSHVKNASSITSLIKKQKYSHENTFREKLVSIL